MEQFKQNAHLVEDNKIKRNYRMVAIILLRDQKNSQMLLTENQSIEGSETLYQHLSQHIHNNNLRTWTRKNVINKTN